MAVLVLERHGAPMVFLRQSVSAVLHGAISVLILSLLPAAARSLEFKLAARTSIT